LQLSENDTAVNDEGTTTNVAKTLLIDERPRVLRRFLLFVSPSSRATTSTSHRLLAARVAPGTVDDRALSCAEQ